MVTLWDVGHRPADPHATRDIPSRLGSWRTRPTARSWPPPAMDGKVKLWDAAGTLLRTLDDHVRPPRLQPRWQDPLLAPRAAAEIRAGISPPAPWSHAHSTTMHRDDHAGDHARRQGPGHRLFDGTILLRDTATGRVLRAFRDHRNPVTVNYLAFSADGKTLAAGSCQPGGDALGSRHRPPGAGIKGHTGTIQDIAFSPDGVHLACASNDETVRIWDATRDQEFRSLQREAAMSAASPSAPTARTSPPPVGTDRHLRDVATGQFVRTFRGHTAAVHCVAIRRDGRLARLRGQRPDGPDLGSRHRAGDPRPERAHG